MRVLVADDSSVVRIQVAATLRAAGLDVLVAAAPYTDLCQPERWAGIDVAIIDLHLDDDVDGGDILEWLASHQPHVRRVLLTGSHRDDETVHVRAARSAHVTLHKPAGRDELLQAVGAL